MIFRDYQEEAIDSPFQYFQAGNTGNPVIAMPTGTGKSPVIAGFIQRALQTYPNQRILKLTHVKELIEQNFSTLMKIWPTAPAGIYSAGVGRKDLGAPITYCGIQSVAKKPELFGHVDLALVDECHLVSPNANTSYQKFFNSLKEVNPYFKVIGLTATPFRLGQGLITDTDSGIFTDICCDMTGVAAFNRFVAEGYLAPLIPKPTTTTIDLDGVRIHGGEFVGKDLQAATDKEEITWAALQETLELGHNRKHWLIFATGVEHCQHIVAMLDVMGIPAAAVHSKLTDAQRLEALTGFAQGKYRALVNNNVLTTGYDFPGIDLIVALRATNSPGLWVQMLGRGTRPVYAPGFDLQTVEGRLTAMMISHKQNCMVLDFTRNTTRLGPINDPVMPKAKGKGGGVAPVRLCEQCSTYLHASIRVCPHCGYEFPIDVKFGFNAGTDQVMVSDDLQIEVFKVDRVTYQKHIKDGRPDAIKVSYFCGLRMFNTYVCLEHGGFAAKKGRDWWRKAWSPELSEFIPETTETALESINHLLEPKQIRVWVNKKYPEIMAYNYGDDESFT